MKDLEYRVTGFGIRPHPRRHDERVGAELAGLPSAHRGANAVRLRLVARSEYDAATDDHRPAAQRGVVALLDGGVERVEISVQDGGRRPSRRSHGRHEHMFAPRSDVATEIRRRCW